MNGLCMFASLSEYLAGRGDTALTDHDLAVLADWSSTNQRNTPNQDWKRAYALLREGADLLLRRRARSSVDLSARLFEQAPERTTVLQADGKHRTWGMLPLCMCDVCVGIRVTYDGQCSAGKPDTQGEVHVHIASPATPREVFKALNEGAYHG